MTRRQIRTWFRKRENRGAAAAVAERFGVSRSLVSMWLYGDRSSEILDREVPKFIATWRKK